MNDRVRYGNDGLGGRGSGRMATEQEKEEVHRILKSLVKERQLQFTAIMGYKNANGGEVWTIWGTIASERLVVAKYKGNVSIKPVNIVRVGHYSLNPRDYEISAITMVEGCRMIVFTLAEAIQFNNFIMPSVDSLAAKKLNDYILTARACDDIDDPRGERQFQAALKRTNVMARAEIDAATVEQSNMTNVDRYMHLMNKRKFPGKSQPLCMCNPGECGSKKNVMNKTSKAVKFGGQTIIKGDSSSSDDEACHCSHK